MRVYVLPLCAQLEGDAGRIYAELRFSDLQFQVVDPTELNVTSIDPSFRIVPPDSQPSSEQAPSRHWRGAVAVDAYTHCADMAQVQWLVCGQPAAEGMLPVSIELPPALAMTFALDQLRLSAAEDAASQPPIGIATQTAVRVAVVFEGIADPIDFRLDARTNITVAEVWCAYVDAAVLHVRSGAECPSLTVTASVSAPTFNFTHTASIPIVSISAMALRFTAWPDTARNRLVSRAQLSRVQCTDRYHHALAHATATLTDGTEYDVSAASSFTSTSPAALAVEGRRMRAVAAGAPFIAVDFHGAAASVPLPVVDDGGVDTLVRVAALHFGISLGAQQTLVLLRGGTRSTTSRVDFTDGSRFDSVGMLAGWVELAQMVNFTSAQPAAIGIDGGGTVTLLQNHHARVAVGGALTCSASAAAVPTSVVEMAANLQAIAGDVDLGALSGVQFAQGTDGELPLGVFGSVSGRLVNFQIEVAIDTAYLAAIADSQTAQYPGAVVTLNSPPSLIKLVANDAVSQLSGLSIPLATARLRVVQSGVTLITGSIIELISIHNGQTIRVQERPIDAGTGYAALSTAARRTRSLSLQQMGPPSLRAAEVASAQRKRRRRAQASEGGEGEGTDGGGGAPPLCDPCNATRVLGDVSGDCKLTSYDIYEASVLYLRRNEEPAPSSLLCAWRQEQLDLTLDGAFKLVDVQYLVCTQELAPSPPMTDWLVPRSRLAHTPGSHASLTRLAHEPASAVALA